MTWNKKNKVFAAIGMIGTLFLAGCSNSGGQAAGTNSGGSAHKIAFIQGVAGDEFYISMQCGIEEASKAAGYTVSTQGPQKFDPTLQKPLVDSIIASKPDALLIAPTDTTAMQAPIAAAAAAGIKVVLVDTTLDDPSVAVSTVASDNEGGGKAAFSAIKSAHPKGGKVLVIDQDPGVSTTNARALGFEEAAKQDSTFTFLDVQYAHNEPSTAAEIVTAALQKDPDIVGIFAVNMFAAEGAATGVQQAGKQGGVTIVGFDAGPAQIQALKNNVVQALVAQQPSTIGMDGVKQALAALDGKPTEKKIQTGFTVITKANLDGEGAAAIYKSSCN